MEAIYSYETSVDFHRITRRYITEDRPLHTLHCENLKSYIPKLQRLLHTNEKLIQNTVAWKVLSEKGRLNDPCLVS
jgi:hypothetical protein